MPASSWKFRQRLRFIYRNGPHEKLTPAQAQNSQVERKSTIEETANAATAELVGYNRIHLNNLQFHHFLTSVGQGQLASCNLQIQRPASTVNTGKLNYRFTLNQVNQTSTGTGTSARYLKSQEKLDLLKLAETIPSQLSLPDHFAVGVQVQLNLLVVISIVDNLYAREVEDGKLLRITVDHSSTESACSFLRVSGLQCDSSNSLDSNLPFTVHGCVTNTAGQNPSFVTHFDLIKFAKLLAFAKELIERNHAHDNVNASIGSSSNMDATRSPFFASVPVIQRQPSLPSYEVFFSFDHHCLLTFKSNPDICRERMIIMPWCDQPKVDELLVKTVAKVVSKITAKTASTAKKTTKAVKVKRVKKTT